MTTGTTPPRLDHEGGLEPGAQRTRAETRWQRTVRMLVDKPETGILAAAIVTFVVWSVATPHFLSVSNLLSIAQQIALIGIAATGMTFLIVAGELDLSVGSMYGFLAVIAALAVSELGWPTGVGVAVALVGGGLIGYVNGLLTTHLRIPSFIVTLGMLGMLRGLALGLSGGLPVGPIQADWLRGVTSGFLLGFIPAQVVWLTVVLVLGGLTLTRTRFGHHVYASGGNRDAAQKAGIDAGRVKRVAFVLTGLLVGIVAAISVGWFRSANPLTGQGFELQVIAAVIIGGTSLFGGAGTVRGTFLGAAIIGMLNNGLVLIGIDTQWQRFATGLLIVVAALINVTLRRNAMEH